MKKGQTHTEDSKNLIRESRQGKPNDPETNEKIRAKLKNRVRPSEVRMRIRDTLKRKYVEVDRVVMVPLVDPITGKLVRNPETRKLTWVLKTEKIKKYRDE